MISRLNEILLFSFPTLFVSAFFLVNIGKEVSLPEFRISLMSSLLPCFIQNL